MAAINEYIVGTLVELDAVFTNAAGQLVDPTVVTAEIRTPDGVITDLTSTVQRTGQGQYAATFMPTMNGLHQYRMVGTKAAAAAGENAFMAQSGFPS